MAQLSDDCFALGGDALSIGDAVALIRSRVPAVTGVETVPLDEADGRVLAADIMARHALPPFSNSAVDGYAVRHADLAPAGETRLRIALRLQAGSGPGRIRPGEAARIFTGAAMPDGADTVFMQEDVTVDGAIACLPAGLALGANARPAGEEAAVGTLLLRSGRRLRPQDVALAVAAGHDRVTVRTPLRVAVFSTGDELAATHALQSTQIFDSNRPMLRALLRRVGATTTDLGILPDDPEHLADAVCAAAREHDLVLTSGGVSAGEADHVKSAVERIGRLDYWRFAIKPGRPLALGRVGTAAFAGLPGNPVAVFVTFTQVVRPLLAALAGEDYTPPLPLPVLAGFSLAKKPGRAEFLRVALEPGSDGAVARRHPVEGAGILSSLTATDGLVRLDESVTRVEVGQFVPFIPFASLLA